MRTEVSPMIQSGLDIDYGTYNLVDYFLDSDASNSVYNRFAPIDVWNPDYKIINNSDKKQENKAKGNKKTETD